MKTYSRVAATFGIILVVALGALAFHGIGKAPEGAGTFEAVRVALDPGAEYAVLHVEGMT